MPHYRRAGGGPRNAEGRALAAQRITEDQRDPRREARVLLFLRDEQAAEGPKARTGPRRAMTDDDDEGRLGEAAGFQTAGLQAEDGGGRGGALARPRARPRPAKP